MIDKILIFIIFLGPLIFFHELGHFLFARLFGVRVETFSIGFGPKLFKFKRGGTDYALSLIPLGGYVKMFGDDPLNAENLSEEEKKCAFNYKSKWARFWIVFGGPLANFILAYIIFLFLLLMGEKVPLAQFGNLSTNSILFEKGIRSSDIVKKLNGSDILGITDLTLDENSIVKDITVERNGKLTKIELDITFKTFMEEYFNYMPKFRKPVMIDNRGNKFAITTSSKKMKWDDSLEKIAESSGEQVYLYKFKKGDYIKGELPQEIDLNEERIISLPKDRSPENFWSLLGSEGYFPLDLRVESVVKNSPADRVQMKEGDLIVSINKNRIHSFDHLRNALQKEKKGSAIELEFYRHTILEKVSLIPDVDENGDEKAKRIGVYSAGEFLPVNYVEAKGRGFGNSIIVAFSRTYDSIEKTLVGFKKLLTQEVSFKSIGGPLAIGKVASDSFNISLSYFFKLMAFISVNLGIINLFPIPVLDGGHIFFLFLELVNRGPLSRRKLELAQQFGVSLLFLLIFAALFNDVARLLN